MRDNSLCFCFVFAGHSVSFDDGDGVNEVNVHRGTKGSESFYKLRFYSFVNMCSCMCSISMFANEIQRVYPLDRENDPPKTRYTFWYEANVAMCYTIFFWQKIQD